MTGFDPNVIGDEAIRNRYLRVLSRGENFAAALRGSFGGSKPPVATRFVDEPAFNAYAGWDGGGYVLELTRPVPLLLNVLFEQLLGDPRLFPWIGVGGEPAVSYDIDFIVDPLDFAGRRNWRIALSDDRAFTAGILTEIATAFIQMHELGHVMSGHIEAHREVTGLWRIKELHKAHGASPPGRTHMRRLRAWEADADSVGAAFLVRYVSELVDHARTHPAAARAFGLGEHTPERVLSMTAVALFALFSYLRGGRYRLGRTGGHPHPLVRAFYVKDMLFSAAQREWKLDLDVLADLAMDCVDEMVVALETLGLFHAERFAGDYLDRVDVAIARLMDDRRRFRPESKAWAWIDWSGEDDAAQP